MQLDNTSIRRHVRQPTGMPIQVSPAYRPDYRADGDKIANISLGGVCFTAGDAFEVDQSIRLRLPLLNPGSSLDGRVVWCNQYRRGYRVGLEFDDPAEVERSKMVEQIVQIEKFRREIERRDGRELSSEEAAREWIGAAGGDSAAPE